MVAPFIKGVSKRQVAFESKAQADEKAQPTCDYGEHFKEVCDAPWCNIIGANPALRGNAAIPPQAD
jgi:hypothetical protein